MSTPFFLYARKSTDSEEKQVLSIEAQLTELRLFAEKEKLMIKQEFVESMTAKVPGRPLFNEMMSRIEKGEAKGIIAWHPDRLARNSVDGGRIVYLLDTEHINFLKFPTFWFENTPQGKFMLNIAFGQSKYYVDNLSENVKRGNRQKLRNGGWPGRAPIGYLNDKVTGNIIVDPHRGPIVTRVFQAYATGKYSQVELREVATTWGLVSRDKRNKGGLLAYNCFQKILANPFYYGLMRRDGELYQGKHEPLITKDLFEQVQEVIRQSTKSHFTRKHHFAFLGLATCVYCGCSITAERQKGHHYYRCTKKKGKCPGKYIREEKLDEQIDEIIKKVALPTDIYQKMIAEWAKEQSKARQPFTKLKQKIAKDIPEIDSKLDHLLDAHLEGLITKIEYQSKKEALLKKKVDLEERLEKLEQGVDGWLEPMRKFLEAAHQAGGRAELLEKKQMLKKIGSNFQLAAKTLRFSYKKPWRLLTTRASDANWWVMVGLNHRPLPCEGSALPLS
jgi:site-specific DNA recombinase